MIESTRVVGLIVNPIAGIGGRVGLKGSDSPEIVQQAIDLGATPIAQHKTAIALRYLLPYRSTFQLITYPYEMGETVAIECGIKPSVIGEITPGKTSAEDTQFAALKIKESGAEIILFAGGDGTARDIYQAIGDSVPVVGIPAGVKIHSAVYAKNAIRAGELAALFIRGKLVSMYNSEVIDIDEEAFRQGRLITKLYGYLKVPQHRNLLQGIKSGSPSTERAVLGDIARDVIERMQENVIYIIGPGTTTRAITDQLGLEKTLLGVDVIENKRLMAKDVNESQILSLTENRKAYIIITPIGGQGFILGRGNQQISPAVVRQVGIQNIILVSTPEKIYSLKGTPFWVDSGDTDLDIKLRGYQRVICGYHEEIAYKVEV